MAIAELVELDCTDCLQEAKKMAELTKDGYLEVVSVHSGKRHILRIRVDKLIGLVLDLR